jgi:hypothetical protein
MNMKMLEIIALPNGAHRNQTFHGNLPDGWAVIPDDMEIPETFPFVNIEAEEITHYKAVEVMQDVTKTRDVVTVNEDGEEVTTTEEYTEQEMVTEQQPYGVMTVTSMTEGVMPEVKPEDPKPTQLDIIEAQVTYTAMMTDTLLGG